MMKIRDYLISSDRDAPYTFVEFIKRSSDETFRPHHITGGHFHQGAWGVLVMYFVYIWWMLCDFRN
jgi:hypothetical protein